MRRLRFVLNPIGSDGDVHPFLGVGQELHRRGHDVFVLTNPVFKRRVESLGLKFRPIGTREQLQRVGTDPRIHRRFSSWKLALAWGATGTMRETFAEICRLDRPGRTVVVAAVLSFGATIAYEARGIPLATCLIDPDKLRGLDHSPRIPPLVLSGWVPQSLKRLQYLIADHYVVDRAFGAETNRFRAELGLAPISRLVDKWWISGDRVIGFFDEWFAPRSHDWPGNVELVGPTLWDPQIDSDHWGDVEEFLQAGSAPIVFVPGTAGARARQVVDVAVKCCHRLKRRGILLHRRSARIPDDLPPDFRYYSFAPLKRLLPHCAAIVHHGGTGTALQSLGAGIPQLICPRAFNHPDIAGRIRRLGAGYEISPARFRVGTVARSLRRMLDDAELRERCQHWASQLGNNRAIERTCDLLEEMVPRGSRRGKSKDEKRLAKTVSRGRQRNSEDAPDALR